MTTTQPFTVGDTVRFTEPLDPGDEDCRFTVLEDNGDRVLIQDISDMAIPGTKVVRREDVCKA